MISYFENEILELEKLLKKREFEEAAELGKQLAKKCYLRGIEEAEERGDYRKAAELAREVGWKYFAEYLEGRDRKKVYTGWVFYRKA